MKILKTNHASLSMAILGWLAFTASAACAAHPLITDDAGTVGKGGVQLEITGTFAVDRETLDDGARKKSEAAEAALTFVYGLAETLDLAVAAPYQWLSDEQSAALPSRESGLSDVTLDLKWRFFERNGWRLALKPGMTLPSGDAGKGLGGGHTIYRLFFIATRELQSWGYHLNAGYIRNENSAGDRKDLWHVSLAGEAELLKGLKAVANVGMVTNPASGSSTHPAFALVGLIYELRKHVSLDAGIRFGLTDPETDVSYTAGVTFRF